MGIIAIPTKIGLINNNYIVAASTLPYALIVRDQNLPQDMACIRMEEKVQPKCRHYMLAWQQWAWFIVYIKYDNVKCFVTCECDTVSNDCDPAASPCDSCTSKDCILFTFIDNIFYILPLVTSTFQKCSSGSLAATVYHLKLLKSIKRCFVAVGEYDNL